MLMVRLPRASGLVKVTATADTVPFTTMVWEMFSSTFWAAISRLLT